MKNDLTRRDVCLGAAVVLAGSTVTQPSVAAPGNMSGERRSLRISHQWPGRASGSDDFRDRTLRRFAEELASLTDDTVQARVYSDGVLMPPTAQMAAIQQGRLDLAVFPLSYAAPAIPEFNIALLPALIGSYEQAALWKTSRVGSELRRLIELRGMRIVAWLWQPGGIASRGRPILRPSDVAGLVVRSGGVEFEQFLSRLGGLTRDVPSQQFYSAMQSGAVDAVITSSTSLVDLRLQELSRGLTAISDRSIWFVFEPLVIARRRYDSLTSAQKEALAAAGECLEATWTTAAKWDDQGLPAAFAAHNAIVELIDAQGFEEWRTAAAFNSWRHFAARSEDCSHLLRLARRTE